MRLRNAQKAGSVPTTEKIKEGCGDGRSPKNQGGWLQGYLLPKDAGEAPEKNEKIELEETGQNLASTLHAQVTCWGFDL